jgi:hypothetical protein
MRKLITTTALLILIGAPAAIAQTGTGGSSTAAKNPPQREAPIGHRQPRAGDLAADKNPNDPNDILSKENAILDRKIKGICRGC